MKITLFRTKMPLPSYIGSEESDSVVLFVHGLGGSYWTWRKFANHLKQNWVEQDSFGLEYDEYYGSQYLLNKIPVIRELLLLWKIIKGPSIKELSEHLKTVVDEVCHDYENVIIIAHSMGGLIARKFIIERLKETKDLGNVKSLITYATPHHGSKIATSYKISLNFFSNFIALQRSKQVLDLGESSNFLITLNAEWRDLRVDDKINFKRVAGFEDWVVDMESSSYLDDENVKKIANKDHFTIIKPNRIRDAAFMVTYNHLKDFHKNLEAKKIFVEDANDFTDQIEEDF